MRNSTDPIDSEPIDRPVVYFLHGLLGTAYGHFDGQIGAWQDRYRLVPVDLPGHGRCPLDAGPEYLDAAFDYLVALVQRFGPGRLVAASYLGGPLAVRCATHRPDLVTSLVLTGFAPGLDKQVFVNLLAGFQRLVDENAELVAEYDRLHGPRWRKTLTAFVEHVEVAYESTALVPPDTLGALDVDTLVINGTLKSSEQAAAEGAPRYGPRIRGRVVAGAGHIASHDAPGPFTAAVEEFWRNGGVR